MRMSSLVGKCLFLIAAFVALPELTRVNYEVNACVCNSFTGTRHGIACGDSCQQAHDAALADMFGSGFQACTYPTYTGACDVRPVYVSVECYWDGAQYCEELSQEYGCRVNC